MLQSSLWQSDTSSSNVYIECRPCQNISPSICDKVMLCPVLPLQGLPLSQRSIGDRDMKYFINTAPIASGVFCPRSAWCVACPYLALPMPRYSDYLCCTGLENLDPGWSELVKTPLHVWNSEYRVPRCSALPDRALFYAIVAVILYC